MEEIRLKQPPLTKEEQSSLISKYIQDVSKFQSYYEQINEPKYLFWTKALHRLTPEGYTAQEAWKVAKIVRKISGLSTPINTPQGGNFTYLRLAGFDRILHNIDLQIGGDFLISRTSGDEKQRFLSRGILEEAIASSQLEGASTTRRHAKRMIAENRKPRNVSERMIYNNYMTLSAIDEDFKEKELSLELLLEMHSMITMDTLDESTDVGKLRVSGDIINVVYEGKIAHVTPSAQFVAEELKKLIEYANDDREFVHPLIKASILHFWMGYLHPFADGNGRLARSIFYWYLLKHKYWGMAYIPISLVIKRAKKQYTYAYIHAEQDGLDLTYFIDYSLRRINLAIGEFERYVRGLEDENKFIEKKLRGVAVLNDRQKQLVYYLLSDDTNYASEISHRTMNGVARNTARADLHGLSQEGLLQRVQEGRRIKYYATAKLKELVKSH